MSRTMHYLNEATGQWVIEALLSKEIIELTKNRRFYKDVKANDDFDKYDVMPDNGENVPVNTRRLLILLKTFSQVNLTLGRIEQFIGKHGFTRRDLETELNALTKRIETTYSKIDELKALISILGV